ncbi:hypothetical protein [Roseovarius nanhaiticus]|uniref:AAA+ family ATPase n=1 Tax=Roseovarius nanhaiticus TaxID=573024 RepID=A0A1N7HEA8_9RHOB|nr:hypothetical protein [Roseovarius nanhaiticus]SIS23038.1 hypothetical protein SAMN05421666_2822 [Roseovarius nanhaiticus]
MKKLALPLVLAFALAMPASAQDTEAPSKDGLSLIEDGARMFFEGLMQEAEPALEGMREMADRLGPQLRGFAEEMGPALAEILKDVEDLSVYEAPEQLPNGDIIIRRKEPLPPAPERPELGDAAPEGDIEI